MNLTSLIFLLYSKITRFKQDFLPDLQSILDNLVDITKPICHSIDNSLASIQLFDTSGVEAYVAENNPKYDNHIIKQLKAYAKTNNFNASYDPYKSAYSSMPSSAKANYEVKQQYINGHFCYAYKFGILTNGLGDASFLIPLKSTNPYSRILISKKAFIPLKVKLSMNNADYTFNENGIPCCPHNSSLPMKWEGSKSHLKSRLPTMKFVCPKMK